MVKVGTAAGEQLVLEDTTGVRLERLLIGLGGYKNGTVVSADCKSAVLWRTLS